MLTTDVVNAWICGVWTRGQVRAERACKLRKSVALGALFYSSVDFTDASHWCVRRCIELSTDERNKTTPWWIIPRDICSNVSGVSFCWQFSWLILIFNNVILSLLKVNTYLFVVQRYIVRLALITVVWLSVLLLLATALCIGLQLRLNRWIQRWIKQRNSWINWWI